MCIGCQVLAQFMKLELCEYLAPWEGVGRKQMQHAPTLQKMEELSC